MTGYPAAFCPHCGAELVDREVEGRDRRYCTDCERVVWHNPVPAAGVAVVDDRGVLCTRRDVDPGRGEWAVPGGHMEAEEAPAESAARELREEVGVAVDPDDLRLLGTRTTDYAGVKHLVILDYWVPARRTDGDPYAGSEVSEVAWVAPEGTASVGRFLSGHEDLVARAWERFEAER